MFCSVRIHARHNLKGHITARNSTPSIATNHSVPVTVVMVVMVVVVVTTVKVTMTVTMLIMILFMIMIMIMVIIMRTVLMMMLDYYDSDEDCTSIPGRAGCWLRL